MGSPGFDQMPGHAKCGPLMEARTSVVLLLVPSLNKLKRLFLEGWKDAIGMKKAMEKLRDFTPFTNNISGNEIGIPEIPHIVR